MVTHAHTADFLIAKRGNFFLLKIHYLFQQEETFSKNKHFHIKWKLKTMAFLLFPTHEE